MHHTHRPADVVAEINEILERNPLFASIDGPLDTQSPASAHWRLAFKETSIEENPLIAAVDAIWELERADGTKLFEVRDTRINRRDSLELLATSDLDPLDVRYALAKAIDVRPLMPALA